MKIVFNTDSLIMGGAEKLAIQYVEFLSKKFEVILLINEDNGLEKNILLDKIPNNVKYMYVTDKKIIYKINKYRELKNKNFVYKLFYSYYLKKRRKSYQKNIVKIIKGMDYDILIDFYCKIPLSIADKRTISWLHSSLEHVKNKNDLEKKFNKIRKVIVITESMKKQFMDLFPLVKNVKKLYNPFNITKIKTLAKLEDNLNVEEKKLLKKNYILSCSRLDKNKDVKTSLYAFEKIKNKYSGNFLILGEGPSKRELEELVIKLKLTNRVFFLGTQLNPYVWMKNCDIFVHSSKKEGFGMVLVEALINNCVVLATDCPVGPREILDNENYGLLTPVGDVDKMAIKMLDALNNNELRSRYKKKSQERIKIFSEEEIYNQLLDIITNYRE